MKKSHIISIVVIIFIITVIPLLMYWYKFNGWILSNNTEDWAFFGSYLSGVLLPFYTLINITIFIIIMHKIINYDKKAHNEKINTEEAILISQFRKEILNRFIKELDSILRYPAFKGKNKSIKHTFNGLFLELSYQIADLETYFIGIKEWEELLNLQSALNNLRSYCNSDEFKSKNAEDFLKDNMKDIADFSISIRQLNRKGQIHILKKLHERETFPQIVKEAVIYELSKKSVPKKKEKNGGVK